MGEQLTPADAALLSRVLGHEIEPGLVRTLGPSTLAAIIQAARSDRGLPESVEAATCEQSSQVHSSSPPPKGEALPVVITDEMVKLASIAFDEYVATIPPNDEVDTEPCVRAALEAALLSRGEG